MKEVVVIPARYKSLRFPGKPLIPLLGKPMILWVAELSEKAVGIENVYIATEDERILQVVTEAGFKAVMTSKNALTGTDRLAQAAHIIDADIYINVQGDEPVLNPVDIIKILEYKHSTMHAVINGYCEIGANGIPDNVNIPKVIMNESGKMVYMSRKDLPGFKERKKKAIHYYKQVCIYAFSRDQLLAYAAYGRKSKLEECEDIEILRFLELDIPIQMVRTSENSLAVDVPEDVLLVEKALRKIHGL